MTWTRKPGKDVIRTVLLAIAVGVAAEWPLVAQVNTPNLQLNLEGTAQGRPPDAFESRFVGPAANCFAVRLLDPSNDVVIGSATDCLEDLTPDGADNFVVTNTSIFRIGQQRLVTRATTSLRRLNPLSSSTMTHGTTFYPPPGSDNVLFATGSFAAYRNSRAILRGVVNTDRFLTENVVQFDCHFVIKQPGG